jgi:hypothetical protein
MKLISTIGGLPHVLRPMNNMPKAYMIHDSLSSSFLKAWLKDKVASLPNRLNMMLSDL